MLVLYSTKCLLCVSSRVVWVSDAVGVELGIVIYDLLGTLLPHQWIPKNTVIGMMRALCQRSKHLGIRLMMKAGQKRSRHTNYDRYDIVTFIL